MMQPNMSGAKLWGAILRGAKLQGVNFLGANLSNADLEGAILTDANLRGANLRGTNLRGASLTRANLRGADLTRANLRGADLRGANLHADLRRADLRGVDLRGVDLRGANLRDAKLRDANLEGALLPDYHVLPDTGHLTVYKAVRGAVLTMFVPHDAGRNSCLTSRKCRVERAKVVGSDTPGHAWWNLGYGNAIPTEYVLGEWIEPDSYDDDIRNECTHGIHVLATHWEAKEVRQ